MSSFLTRAAALGLFSSLVWFAPALAASEPVVLGKGTNLAHWLSQSGARGEARQQFITEGDIAYIAELGFEHVRLPIDEVQMWDEQGRRHDEAFALLHDGIGWALAHDLKVVVDLHILRSHHFNQGDKPLWTDPAEQDRFAALWRDLSDALKHYPTGSVVYELMNEPVADDPEDWNRLVARLTAVIRELEPERTIVIGSNMWQGPETFDQLVVPDDPHIILSFHFYEPFMFTHYRTGWNFMKDYQGDVRYPGIILTEDGFRALPDGLKPHLQRFVGENFDRAVLEDLMEQPLRKARKLGLPLYCGEFGVYEAAPSADRLRWYEDVLAIFREHDVSWANWNYKSDQFGIRGNDGEPIEAIRDVLTTD